MQTSIKQTQTPGLSSVSLAATLSNELGSREMTKSVFFETCRQLSSLCFYDDEASSPAAPLPPPPRMILRVPHY